MPNRHLLYSKLKYMILKSKNTYRLSKYSQPLYLHSYFLLFSDIITLQKRIKCSYRITDCLLAAGNKLTDEGRKTIAKHIWFNFILE